MPAGDCTSRNGEKMGCYAQEKYKQPVLQGRRHLEGGIGSYTDRELVDELKLRGHNIIEPTLLIDVTPTIEHRAEEQKRSSKTEVVEQHDFTHS